MDTDCVSFASALAPLAMEPSVHANIRGCVDWLDSEVERMRKEERDMYKSRGRAQIVSA
jgi:hypothetical protein